VEEKPCKHQLLGVTTHPITLFFSDTTFAYTSSSTYDGKRSTAPVDRGLVRRLSHLVDMQIPGITRLIVHSLNSGPWSDSICAGHPNLANTWVTKILAITGAVCFLIANASAHLEKWLDHGKDKLLSSLKSGEDCHTLYLLFPTDFRLTKV